MKFKMNEQRAMFQNQIWNALKIDNATLRHLTFSANANTISNLIPSPEYMVFMTEAHKLHNSEFKLMQTKHNNVIKIDNNLILNFSAESYFSSKHFICKPT